MSVKIGETFIHGRGSSEARAVLAAAKRAGVPPSRIRATDSGYIVPDAVADQLDAAPRWAAPNAVF